MADIISDITGRPLVSGLEGARRRKGERISSVTTPKSVLNKKETDKLAGVNSKFLRGDKLSEKEEEVLSVARKEGLLAETTFMQRLGARVTGERGLENLQDISGLSSDILTPVGALKFLSKINPAGRAANLVGTGAAAALSDFFIKQGLIKGEEKPSKLQAAISGTAEVVLPGAVKGAQAGGRALKNLFTIEKKEFKAGGEETAEFLLAKGGTVDLARTFQSDILDFMDGVATVGIFSRGTMREAGQKRQDILEEAVLEFSRKYVREGTPIALAKTISQAIKKNVEFADDLRRRKYLNLDAGALNLKGNQVDLSFIGKGRVSFTDAAEILENVSIANGKTIRSKMRRAANSLDAGVSNPLTKAEEKELREMFVDLGQDVGSADSIIASTNAKRAKQTAASFSDDLEFALEFTDRNAKLFMDNNVREIANTNPAMFFTDFFREGNTETVVAVMKMVDSKGKSILTDTQKNGLRAQFLTQINPGSGETMGIIARSSKSVPGGFELIGERLAKNIDNFEKGVGLPASQALFGPGGMERLKQLARFAKVLQAKAPEKTGAMAIMLGTPGAVSTITAGAASLAMGLPLPTMIGFGTAGFIIMGPKVFANFLNSPKVFNQVLKGAEKRLDNPVDLAFFLSTAVAQMQAAGINAKIQTAEDLRRIRATPPISGAGTRTSLTQ